MPQCFLRHFVFVQNVRSELTPLDWHVAQVSVVVISTGFPRQFGSGSTAAAFADALNIGLHGGGSGGLCLPDFISPECPAAVVAGVPDLAGGPFGRERPVPVV